MSGNYPYSPYSSVPDPTNLNLSPGAQAYQQASQPNPVPPAPAPAQYESGYYPQYPQYPNEPMTPTSTYLPSPTAVPTPPMYAPVAPAYTATPKSKIAAGLLGIFLGAFGIHNFYLGKTGRGLAQLLITVCTLGILGIVSEIWGLVEGILILASRPGSPWHRDGHGYELSD